MTEESRKGFEQTLLEPSKLDDQCHGAGYALVFEFQKIKSYLFASHFLRETRGASLLLDHLARVKARQLVDEIRGKLDPSAQVIYLGGGSGQLFFSSNESANFFKSKFSALCATAAPKAPLAIEFTGPDDADTFAARIAIAIQRCSFFKLTALAVDEMMVGRWFQPCTSCGHGSAVQRIDEHGLHDICKDCSYKRSEANSHYYDVKPGKDRARSLGTPKALANRYGKASVFTKLAIALKTDVNTIRLSQDFEEIGKASKPEGYLGFVFADGNAMGEVVKAIARQTDSVKSLDQIRAFSDIADSATCDSVVDTLNSLFTDQNLLPYEVIMAGGDDLMIALPAQHALQFASRYVTQFHQKSLEYQTNWFGDSERGFAPEGLTTSAGVLLTHCHYPAVDMVELASGLLKNAKKAGSLDVANGSPPESMIDFMILHESATTGVLENREREYSVEQGGWQIKRTERPYTALGIEKLLDLVHRCATTLPKTQLKSLRSSLFANSLWQTRFEANRILQQLTRSGALADHNELDALFNKDLDPYPFRRNGSSLSSPFSDIVELLEFTDPTHLFESPEKSCIEVES